MIGKTANSMGLNGNSTNKNLFLFYVNFLGDLRDYGKIVIRRKYTGC